jgi:protein gp37
MATTSNIEWTEMTWNPVTGCVKVSPGCKHCYAERMAKRLFAMGAERYQNAFKPTLHYDLIDLPKRWKKPRVIFVNSMSDLFQEAVPVDFSAPPSGRGIQAISPQDPRSAEV